MEEYKWMVLPSVISITLGVVLFGIMYDHDSRMAPVVLESSLVFEILVFLALGTFVVFGVKGFFEKYSQKLANAVIFVSGVLLAAAIFLLSYQILFVP